MTTYDVVVIGGGPAGLIAAGRAAELGARVLLLEKNQELGRKLLMTGGGRCNFTNNLSRRQFAEAFGLSGRFLLSGLSRFGSNEIINFFAEQGVSSRVEADGRVFPKSNQASEILKALVGYFKTGGGEIKTGIQVVKIISQGNKIAKLILADQTEVLANNFIVATGGKTYPLSGSTGDAYAWLKALGHKIITPQAVLSPIIVKKKVRALEGLSLGAAEISLYQNNKKIKAEFGDFIFTDLGISGPAALNLSRAIAGLENKNLTIKIDFFPTATRDSLNEKIQSLIMDNKQGNINNILSQLAPKRLINFGLLEADINPEKKGNGFTRVERAALVSFFKEYTLNVFGLKGWDEAMITAGGVGLKEVDPKTMKSKIVANLYLAGEILDLAGPTGGYNLQVAWTTGYLAGDSAAVGA